MPSRLLDTRDGTGVSAGRVSGGQTIDIVAAGRGGVPASGVETVVLNVTSVEPTLPGYVTVHAHGAGRPGVSSLNYTPGYNVPSLVMCRVGTGGKISLYSHAGLVDLVADVVGYFGASGAQHVAVEPARILDTREGIGAARSRVSSSRS